MVLGLRLRGCLQGQRCGVHFRGVHSARGLRAIAALPRTCILIAACRGAVSSREGKRAQMSNLGLDRGRVCRVPPHGYALGTLVASAEASPATIRYTRSPSVFSDSSLNPSFLRTTAARKARTVCGCQPVERVTV